MKSFRFLQILALIVFCFAIGEAIAVFTTGIIFGISTEEVFHSVAGPTNTSRNLLLTLALLSAILRFFIVPVVYLQFTYRKSLDFLWHPGRIRITHILLVALLFIAIVPLISILIKINNSLQLPAFLSGVETYFRAKETSAQQFASVILSFEDVVGLITALIVVAVVPGIVEEIFFRGIVQSQLYDVVKERNAVLIAAALFSFFHFQFYGFIPRMVLGVILGYLFLRSKNIWYPVVAHIINNMIGVLIAYPMSTAS